jgi:hypothetical protein
MEDAGKARVLGTLLFELLRVDFVVLLSLFTFDSTQNRRSSPAIAHKTRTVPAGDIGIGTNQGKLVSVSEGREYHSVADAGFGSSLAFLVSSPSQWGSWPSSNPNVASEAIRPKHENYPVPSWGAGADCPRLLPQQGPAALRTNRLYESWCPGPWFEHSSRWGG